MVPALRIYAVLDISYLLLFISNIRLINNYILHNVQLDAIIRLQIKIQEDRTMKTINQIRKGLAESKARSAWARGVKVYAYELLGDLENFIESGYVDCDDALSNFNMFDTILLNGAYDWYDYSFGGCSLIYDTAIAQRLCNNTELKITKNGHRYPNKRETWLEVQARALHQASRLLWQIYKEA